MVLNNEKQCTTGEKSARYTEISSEKEKNITKLEEELYKKWLDILQLKIKKEYGEQFNDSKIKKLAQENARYFVSVFATTKMIHTVPWIQLNRIISFMDKFNQKAKTDFERRLVEPFEDFIKCFEKLNIIDKNALSNHKERSLSLFAKRKVTDEFGYSYATNYKGSFAQLAQAHRHRTIQYNMELLEEKEFFIPPILKDNPLLVKEWQNDMNLVSDIYPQGELVSINEIGSFDMFIGKTKETLLKYSESLQKQNHELV